MVHGTHSGNLRLSGPRFISIHLCLPPGWQISHPDFLNANLHLCEVRHCGALIWSAISMLNLNWRRPAISACWWIAPLFLSLVAQCQQIGTRRIAVDIGNTTGPLDRFFDLSVGSDYPGTLIRDDSQAQLKLAVDELGFRYIRFHAIFHDVLGTVRIENGKPCYNWTKIDQLYDGLLARHIKPFVELGFTPKALATSPNSIFYWNGNTSHPESAGWRDVVSAFIRHIDERYGRDEVHKWFFVG